MKDFFISYNKADVDWAKWVAGTLEEHGYTTIIQAWDFKPGNNFVLEMHDSISSCKKIILILSQSYLNSEYCQAEWANIFKLDPAGKNAKIIPIRVEKVEPKGLLAGIIYIDIFDQIEETATKKLLNGIGFSENQRKKSEFPLNKINRIADKQSENESEVQFLFDLEEGDKIDRFSIVTKNNLREWYYSDRKSNFKFIINDKRQLPIRAHLNEIESKLNKEELSRKEENEYENYKKAFNTCERERQLKEKAVDFFLKDVNLQAYLCINYLELLDVVKIFLNMTFMIDQNIQPPSMFD